jgi:hypothetical protein
VPETEAFAHVFQRLRSILIRHVPPLVVTEDAARGVSLVVDFPAAPAPARYFGGVAIRRGYVSYYLMPVYGAPELLNGASTDLLKRMQGKSCFNFSKVDDDVFRELAALTDRAVPLYLERLPQMFAGQAAARREA